MHFSSLRKFEAFVETYIKPMPDLGSLRVLDIGSRQTREGIYNYGHTIKELGMTYVGLDMENGLNVDYVPTNPMIWDDLEAESFDFVISGQAYEHNPFPWITTAEIARVLKVGGIAFIIAPSAGNVHRFPYDCWRYYPDSWGALAAVAGLELVETIREPDEYKGKVGGVGWMDAVMIARKKPFDDANPRDDFYQNLKEVVQPFVNRRYAFDPVAINKGPSFEIYARLALTEPQEDKGQPRADKVSLRRKRLAAAKRRERAEGGNAKERPRQRQDGPRRPRVAMPGQAVPTGPRPDRQAADRERPARKGPARNRRNVKNNRPIKD